MIWPWPNIGHIDLSRSKNSAKNRSIIKILPISPLILRLYNNNLQTNLKDIFTSL
jgi:hypothetical protein